MLGVLVVVVGVPLIRYIPLDALRVIVGALLLVLGLVVAAQGDPARAAGTRRCTTRTRSTPRPWRSSARTGAGVPGGRDAVGFAVAFKGVFLEGTEVVLIVISLGAAQHRLGLAAWRRRRRSSSWSSSAWWSSRQLSEVPENTIKTAVGVMLTSFGIFWVGEGAGIHWPGGDLAIPVLVVFFVVVYPRLHRAHEDEAARRRCPRSRPRGRAVRRHARPRR